MRFFCPHGLCPPPTEDRRRGRCADHRSSPLELARSAGHHLRSRSIVTASGAPSINVDHDGNVLHFVGRTAASPKLRAGLAASHGRQRRTCPAPARERAHLAPSRSPSRNQNRRSNERRGPIRPAEGRPSCRPASAPGTSKHGTQEQNAYRCHAPRGNSGRGTPQRPGRGVRLRICRPQAAARQYLSGEGDARRAVAAGGVRRLRRQPPRLPGLQRNPSRLLSNPVRRPAGAAAGGGRGRGRGRGGGRRTRRSAGAARRRSAR